MIEGLSGIKPYPTSRSATPGQSLASTFKRHDALALQWSRQSFTGVWACLIPYYCTGSLLHSEVKQSILGLSLHNFSHRFKEGGLIS